MILIGIGQLHLGEFFGEFWSGLLIVVTFCILLAIPELAVKGTITIAGCMFTCPAIVAFFSTTDVAIFSINCEDSVFMKSALLVTYAGEGLDKGALNDAIVNVDWKFVQTDSLSLRLYLSQS
ncbi:unnamed protein product [Leptidea sinapis]|uniref:Uncharacterized protein n=1 Tax=Leptidea sinapis TaxID=189913 RepID=A0A5E4PR58_9NEOP|nr:unnamed protein product [Leptidea sinapis]